MADSPEEQSAPAPSEILVRYIGGANVRILTSEELSTLGVTRKRALRWDASNDKTVSLSKTNSDALVESLPTEFVVA